MKCIAVHRLQILFRFAISLTENLITLFVNRPPMQIYNIKSGFIAYWIFTCIALTVHVPMTFANCKTIKLLNINTKCLDYHRKRLHLLSSTASCLINILLAFDGAYRWLKMMIKIEIQFRFRNSVVHITLFASSAMQW